MEIKASTKYPPDHLDRLATFLNYQLSASLFFFSSFIVRLFIFAAIIVGGVFIPYMIYVLLKEGRNGWIMFFNLMILPPLLLSIIFIPSYFPAALMISVGLFYCYCFFLRIAVGEWIRERNWKLQMMEQRASSGLRYRRIVNKEC